MLTLNWFFENQPIGDIKAGKKHNQLSTKKVLGKGGQVVFCIYIYTIDLFFIYFFDDSADQEICTPQLTWSIGPC